jgi:hypothetical protein
MKTISRVFYSMPANCLFFLLVPIFYFLFVLAYDPFDISDFLAVGKERFTLNLILTSLILLGVMTLSRMLLFILRRIIDLNWSLYIVWCVGEVVFAGLMFSILLGIGWYGVHPYLWVMTRCILLLAAILVFPYAIISMAVQIYVLNKRVKGPVVDEKTLIRFHDEQKRLKLIVSSEAILYIEAEDNYVHIVHLDNGRVRDFPLRSSMRALEEMLARHGLVRCHRSYFINAAHVDLVRKDANGFALAQLDWEDIKPIPVSKRYYEAVTAVL